MVGVGWGLGAPSLLCAVLTDGSGAVPPPQAGEGWDILQLDGSLRSVLVAARRRFLPNPPHRRPTHDLDAFLEARARLFVADPERGAGPQGISMLFSWFEPDFDAGPQGSARGFVEAHREDVSGVNFEVFLGYDWTLNGE